MNKEKKKRIRRPNWGRRDIEHFVAAGVPLVRVLLRPESGEVPDIAAIFDNRPAPGVRYFDPEANSAARKLFASFGQNGMKAMLDALCEGEAGKELYRSLTGSSGENSPGERVVTLYGEREYGATLRLVISPLSISGEGCRALICPVEWEKPETVNRMGGCSFDYLVQLPLPLLLADLDGTVIRCSAKAEDLFGYTESELAGRRVEMLYQPSLREEEAFAVEKSLELVGSFTGTVACRRRDGKDLAVETNVRFLREKDGRPLARVELYRDITERRRVERDLIESEKRYRGLIESQSDMIVRFDSNGLFTFANDAYCLKFGKSRKHLIGKPFMHLVHEDDLPSTIQAMQNLEKPPYRVSIEQRALTVEGWRWIAWEDYAIKDEKGRTVEIQGVGRDISGYKQMQEDLLHEIELIKLISSISSSFINMEPAEVSVGITRALERIGRFTGFDRVNVYLLEDGKFRNSFGWKDSSIESQKGRLHEAEVSRFPWWMKKLSRFESIHIPVLEELPPEAAAERTVLRSLSIRSMVAVPMVYNQSLQGFLGLVSIREEKTWRDEDVALLSTVADIVANALEHQRAETELEQSKRNLQRSERLVATGRLAASIAHEINNPLQAITANIGFLAKSLPDDFPQKRVLEQIKIGIIRIKNTVRQLLDIHRSKVEVSEEVSINETIDSTLNLVENQLIINKIEVVRLMEENLTPVRGLAQELFQVFMNIILNAMDAMPRGGMLTIRTLREGDRIHIHFTDTGEGISEADLEHIFDPFYTTKSKMLGTGLGLSIVKGIVESFGGDIEVRSVFGEGASFILSFPVL